MPFTIHGHRHRLISGKTSPKIHIGNCRWKACRAPELASGDAIEMVMTSFELSEHHMASYLAERTRISTTFFEGR